MISRPFVHRTLSAALLVVSTLAAWADPAPAPNAGHDPAAEAAFVPVPPQIRLEGVTPVPKEQFKKTQDYMKLGGTSFRGWHPKERNVLVSNQYKGVSQLHLLAEPGGKRTRLTSGREPVSDGIIVNDGRYQTILYSTDKGGDENYQIYLFDIPTGKSTLLTDGKSRNTGWVVSDDGKWVAYSSNRRNLRDSDTYLVSLENPAETRCLAERNSPGWGVWDFSPDGKKLLMGKRVSNEEVVLYVHDIATGKEERVKGAKDKTYYTQAFFAEGGRAVYTLGNDHSDFMTIGRIDLETGEISYPLKKLSWDVSNLTLSRDGKALAYIVNEDGFSKLHLVKVPGFEPMPVPALAGDIVSSLRWHPERRELGFVMNGYQGPDDVYSLEVDTGNLTRWTKREIPKGMTFIKPELKQIKSFDGLPVSSLVYRPDPGKFPGPRPVVVIFHGGPESQSKPVFRGFYNYYLNELGIALVYPNIRGSLGYGRRFAQMDNGMQREDAFRDAEAVFNWVKGDKGFNPGRIAVMGGSYGGYMTLVCMVRFNDILRCGVDSVGMSNLVNFLKNTSDYRRNNRREEYGDERKPEIRSYLEQVAPSNNAAHVKAPLFIVQGENDPRVPASEAEVMRDAIRGNGGSVWYMTALDEGHGFKKKQNSDYHLNAVIMFFRKHLLDE